MVQLVALAHPHRHHVDLGLLAHHRDALRAVAQRAEPGDVVGMDVRVDGLDQLQVELGHQLQVAVDLLQHGIDDQRLPAPPAGQQIAVGARGLIEELTKNHDCLQRETHMNVLPRPAGAGSFARPVIPAEARTRREPGPRVKVRTSDVFENRSMMSALSARHFAARRAGGGVCGPSPEFRKQAVPLCRGKAPRSARSALLPPRYFFFSRPQSSSSSEGAFFLCWSMIFWCSSGIFCARADACSVSGNHMAIWGK